MNNEDADVGYMNEFISNEQKTQQSQNEINENYSNKENESEKENLQNNQGIAQQSQQYEQCMVCNRKFFAGRLALHLKSCKPNKPLKQIKKQISKPKETKVQEEAECKRDFSYSNIDKQQEDSQRSRNQNDTMHKEGIHQIVNDKERSQNNQKVYEYQSQKEYENQGENELEVNPCGERVECGVCGRKFMPERIEKHENACSKNKKPRQVYDSSAARLPENEFGMKSVSKQVDLKQSIKKQKGLKNEQGESSNSNQNLLEDNKQNGTTKTIPKWKIEHQQFIDNIRYNKKLKQIQKEGGDISQIQRPQDDLEALGYIKCEYCHRKFAKDTAERHIPLCKNIINRPKPPRKNSQLLEKNGGESTPKVMEIKKLQNKKLIPKLTPSESEGDSQSTLLTQSEIPSSSSNKLLGNLNSTISITQGLEESNLKNKAVILPDLRIKPGDTKYLTSRKFANFSNNLKNIGEVSEENQKKAYEDIYTRTQQISQVPCPYCERVFAKHAADRHIPICKNIQNRPHPLSTLKNSKLLQEQRKKKDNQYPFQLKQVKLRKEEHNFETANYYYSEIKYFQNPFKSQGIRKRCFLINYDKNKATYQ